jgi:hypothetical protein
MYHNVLIRTVFFYLIFVLNLIFKSGMHILLYNMFFSHIFYVNIINIAPRQVNKVAS